MQGKSTDYLQISQSIEANSTEMNSTPSGSVQSEEIPVDQVTITASPATAQAAEPSMPLGIITLTGLCALVFYSMFRKQWDEHFPVIKQSSAIPCKNCRFYNQNRYLKCAVHPCIASTREAIRCSDYWPRDSQHFSC
ncbi:MAG: hypothetical protein Kow00121_04180 [Elainellaceae cyanobacterium]